MAAAVARPLLEGARRAVSAGWTPLLIAGPVLLLLAFALTFRLPDDTLLHESAALRVAVARLAGGRPGAAAEIERVSAVLELRSLDDPALAPLLRPPLQALQRGLQTLPDGMGELGRAADAVATVLRQSRRQRQQSVETRLRVVSAMLALMLLLPIHSLWRQRQRIRAALRQFSDQLGRGDWEDAVEELRQDYRLGAPSAFDALASGVEGVMGESQRRWQALADLAADWYWETDEQHRIHWLSGSAPALSVLGWSLDELKGRRRDELPFADPPAQGWAAFNAALARHEPFRDVEFRTRARRGGHTVWVSISGRPRLDGRGEFAGYEGVGRDVTERRAAHERLSASEQRWSLMAGLASDWYWQSDEQHRIRPLSREIHRRFPKLAERSEGLPRWEVHRRALTPQQWAEHRADLDAHRPFRSLQFEAEVDDGRYAWLSISGIARFDGQGRFIGYHGVGRDVTLRKEAERLLLRHNEELQRAVSERTRELQNLNLDLEAFSRQLAHELRTPISHVQGLAHLLEARAAARLNGDDRELLRLQVQAAHHMRDTVDALMQLARSTVQAMPMETVDVSALARRVSEELPPLQRRGTVEWQIQPGLCAQASPAALRIVLTNLLGNASKFSRNVERAQVRVSGHTDADGRLRIVVEDNGAGFEPEQSSRLFVPFNRLHAGEEFHGTGIGLTIVQRIVERHGGTVAASGRVCRGARFEFTLTPVDESAAH